MSRPFPSDALYVQEADLDDVVCPECGCDEFRVYTLVEIEYHVIAGGEWHDRTTNDSTHTSIYCMGCDKLLWEHLDPIWRLYQDDVHKIARERIGRDLTRSEIERAARGIQCGLGEHWRDIVETAVELAIER